MMRRCDGTDPNLVRGDERQPCDCGLAFDDVERMVVYPHDPVGGGFARDLELAARLGLTVAQVEAMDITDWNLIKLAAEGAE